MCWRYGSADGLKAEASLKSPAQVPLDSAPSALRNDLCAAHQVRIYFKQLRPGKSLFSHGYCLHNLRGGASESCKFKEFPKSEEASFLIFKEGMLGCFQSEGLATGHH